MSPARTLQAMTFAAAMVLAALASGCGQQTHAIILITADTLIETNVESLRIRVSGARGPGQPFDLTSEGEIVRTRTSMAAPSLLPFQLTVAPIDGNATRTFEVEVEATVSDASGIDLGRRVVRARLIDGYAPGAGRYFTMRLADNCLGVLCAPSDTCVATTGMSAACVSACAPCERPPMPMYDAGSMGLDAGAP